MGEKQERTCLLATHIDPSWPGPDDFHQNIERYLGEIDYDRFIYLSEPNHTEGDYEKIADDPIISYNGELEDEELDIILDDTDRIVHIGAYWDMCYRAVWDNLTEGMRNREGEDSYKLEMPLQLITDGRQTLSEFLESDVQKEDLRYDIEEYFLSSFRSPKKESRNNRDRFLGVKSELQEEPWPKITWKIKPLTA